MSFVRVTNSIEMSLTVLVIHKMANAAVLMFKHCIYLSLQEGWVGHYDLRDFGDVAFTKIQHGDGRHNKFHRKFIMVALCNRADHYIFAL